MVVPGVVVGVGDLRPHHLDDARAGLDEPPGEEEALPEGVAAVAVADFDRLLVEREGLPGPPGDHEVQRPLVVFIELVVGDRLVDLRHRLVDERPQPGPALEPLGENVGAELEIVDADPAHLLHVHVIAVGEERVGVEVAAEEPGRSPLADDVALLERPRQHHERQHRLGRGLQADDVGAEVGEVFGVGRFELPRRAHLVGRVAGHHLVDGGGVVEEAVGGVAHRADHREAVVAVGQQRQILGVLNAGELRGDVLEDTADVVGHVLLRIPQVEMARAPLEVDHDHALGLPPARGRRPRRSPGRLVGPGLEAEEVRQ